MTSPENQAAIRRAFAYQGLPADWAAQVTALVPAPRGRESLLDLAKTAGLGEGQLVLEAGCRDASWSTRLVERFACSVAGVDIVPDALKSSLVEVRTEKLPISFACADLESLPFADSSFDFVWSRDVVEMVADVEGMLRECHRVLKPGGGMMLYGAFATEALEPNERARLFAALAPTPEWGMERVFVERAIASTGFEVIQVEHVSPEWIHHDVLNSSGEDFLWSVRTISEFRRSEAGSRELMGDEWYERMLAWSHWAIYLLLGKLQTTGWALRRT